MRACEYEWLAMNPSDAQKHRIESVTNPSDGQNSARPILVGAQRSAINNARYRAQWFVQPHTVEP